MLYMFFPLAWRETRAIGFRLCIWNAKLSRPVPSPLEKNLILIAVLEGRLIFRDNSPHWMRGSFFFSGAIPPSTKKERTSGPGGPEH